MFLVSLFLGRLAFGQAWSGILSSSRATDWTGAGVVGGIPSGTWTQCGPTITAYSGTGATISNALAHTSTGYTGCAANTFVLLGPGTFTISDGIHINGNNTVLRGSGADLTKLIINGNDPGSSCHLFYNAGFRICGGSGNIGTDSPTHTANWTAGYAQGATSITLDSTTGMSVGTTLFLDQLDDASDGWPAAGDLYVCAIAVNCSSQGGGDNFARPGRSSSMLTKVTGISGGGPFTITISPGLTYPNFRTGQTPGAWWGDEFRATNAGIENLSIDFTTGAQVGVELVNCTNCWVKGLREIFTGGPGNFVFHILCVNCFHATIQDNYTVGPFVQGNTQYMITPHESGSLLIQNNIEQEVVSGIVPNGPFSNSVIAYNYITASYYTGPGPILHNSGEMLNLYEGNDTLGFLGDIIHGSHFMDTLYRNFFDGHRINTPANTNTIVQLQSHNRFFNVVGNVLGDTGYVTTYQTDQANGDSSVYGTGWQGSASGSGTPGNDSNVLRTTMRWANWDTKTNATRFCGNSSDTGWSTTCASTTEIPSGITNFPNPLPTVGDTGIGQGALPASLYLVSKPSWFGTVPFPPVGPDVSGGNVSGWGGHANVIPAGVCFNNLSVDPAYSAQTPQPRIFNAATCYAAITSVTETNLNGGMKINGGVAAK